MKQSKSDQIKLIRKSLRLIYAMLPYGLLATLPSPQRGDWKTTALFLEGSLNILWECSWASLGEGSLFSGLSEMQQPLEGNREGGLCGISTITLWIWMYIYMKLSFNTVSLSKSGHNTIWFLEMLWDFESSNFNKIKKCLNNEY